LRQGLQGREAAQFSASRVISGLTFRRSRTQFGVNFVASLVGEMRLWPAG
jgi:hypothetical protein